MIFVALPDTKQPAAYEKDIAPNLTKGKTLLFAHGFSIHFKTIVPPKNVNVIMVAPKGPGHIVRRQYVEGKGVPSLIAVYQNPARTAKKIALAWAKGIGGTRAGVIETNFKEETETDLFGEQTVLCGGASALVQAGLRNAGRGRLLAGDGLLRMPARIETDRRPDERSRHQRHALLHFRNRQVGRRLASVRRSLTPA